MQPNYLAGCRLLLCTALAVLAIAPQPSHAQGGDTLYGVTAGNRLVTFQSNAPCSIAWGAPISGLQPRESLLGIDFRPANKKLYGLGSSSRLYVIDIATGKASMVGNQPFSVTLSGSEFGFDFNPTVDRIRVVSNSGQNLRLHPDTGVVLAADKALNYKDAPQVKANVVGAAYTNPDTDPNTDADMDLDARAGGAIANPSDCGASRLVTIDLTTGVATDRGAIGTISPLRALAVALR